MGEGQALRARDIHAGLVLFPSCSPRSTPLACNPLSFSFSQTILKGTYCSQPLLNAASVCKPRPTQIPSCHKYISMKLCRGCSFPVDCVWPLYGPFVAVLRDSSANHGHRQVCHTRPELRQLWQNNCQSTLSVSVVLNPSW